MKTTTTLSKSGLLAFSLPDGWIQWTHAGRWLIISAPRVLCTIDAENRDFRAGGNVTYGATINTREYIGRGWAARLHADAVAWLRAAGEEVRCG